MSWKSSISDHNSKNLFFNSILDIINTVLIHYLDHQTYQNHRIPYLYMILFLIGNLKRNKPREIGKKEEKEGKKKKEGREKKKGKEKNNNGHM